MNILNPFKLVILNNKSFFLSTLLLWAITSCNNQKSETPASSASPSPVSSNSTYTSPTPYSSPSPYASATPSGTAITATYTSLNTLLFQPYCASCHNSTTRSGNFDITTYYGLMTKVVARDVYNSAVLKMIQAASNGNTTVRPMPPVSTGKTVPLQYQTALSQWIQNGALQN